jgi:hypothetical protein
VVKSLHQLQLICIKPQICSISFIISCIHPVCPVANMMTNIISVQPDTVSQVNILKVVAVAKAKVGGAMVKEGTEVMVVEATAKKICITCPK